MKKILLLCVLVSLSFAEIIVVYSGKNIKMNDTNRKYYFHAKNVSIENGMLTKNTIMPYKEFLKKYSCNGRDYKIINANFGVHGRNNFVIDCLDK